MKTLELWLRRATIATARHTFSHSPIRIWTQYNMRWKNLHRLPCIRRALSCHSRSRGHRHTPGWHTHYTASPASATAAHIITVEHCWKSFNRLAACASLHFDVFLSGSSRSLRRTVGPIGNDTMRCDVIHTEGICRTPSIFRILETHFACQPTIKVSCRWQ